MLAGEHELVIRLGLSYQAGGLKEEGEGRQAVEIVWNVARLVIPSQLVASRSSLPVGIVKTEFVEVSRQPVGLNPKLIEQPTLGFDGPEREPDVGRFIQRRVV